MVTLQNIFQNTRITDLLQRKVINDISLHNTAQSICVLCECLWLQLYLHVFYKQLYAFSSHLLCSCMSLLKP